MSRDIDRLFNVTLAKRDKDRGGEPIFAQSIATGEVLVDRRAEKWPGLFARPAREEGKSVGSIEEIRKVATREIMASLEEQGLTLKEMAKRLGIAPWQVSELRARYGLTKPGRQNRRPRAAAVVDKEPCEPMPEEPTKVEDQVEEESCVPEAEEQPEEALQPGLHISDVGVYGAKVLLSHLSALGMFFESLETDDEFLVQVEIRRVAG